MIHILFLVLQQGSGPLIIANQEFIGMEARKAAGAAVGYQADRTLYVRVNRCVPKEIIK